MKTIEEINEIAPYDPCKWQQGYGIWQSGFIEGQKIGAEDQKATDIEAIIDYIEDMPQDLTRQDIIDGIIKAIEN